MNQIHKLLKYNIETLNKNPILKANICLIFKFTNLDCGKAPHYSSKLITIQILQTYFFFHLKRQHGTETCRHLFLKLNLMAKSLSFAFMIQLFLKTFSTNNVS